jgi:hypothetical protein
VLLLVGLLILAHYLAPSPGWRTFLEIGVVIVGYCLITVWLETHSTALLRPPSTEADSQALEVLDGEIPSLMSPPIRFYIGADPAIIYGMPEHPTDNLNSNGHHPARTIPFFPEETSNN